MIFYFPSRNLRSLEEALHFIHTNGSCIPNDLAYQLYQACKKYGDLELGRRVQSLLVCNGSDSTAILFNQLIRLFASNGSLVEANKALNQLTKLNQHPWQAIIDGHANVEGGNMALHFYDRIQYAGITPNNFIFSSILKACREVGAIQQGRCIHEYILQVGLQYDVAVGNILVDMYAKLGSLKEANNVFNKLPTRNSLTWNAMISGYAGVDGQIAVQHFDNMLLQNIKPSKVTFLIVLKACSSIVEIEMGRRIHEQILENGLDYDIVLGSATIDMYAKCGALEEACVVFEKLPADQDIVAWATLLAAYTLHDEPHNALGCFLKMQLKNVKPDKVTYLWVLRACGVAGNLQQARHIHEQIFISGLQSNTMVGNSVIDMYIKCDSLAEAYKVFVNLPVRTVVTWSAMIAGYAEYGEGFLALQCFEDMQSEGIKPNKVTFLSTLKACGIVGAIKKGRGIHWQVIKGGLQHDVVMGNTLVDMYAKCGSLGEATKVFNLLPHHNVVTWGAMIIGFAQVGKVWLVMQCFEDMLYYDVRPNDVVFTGIFTAFSYMGLVEEGLLYFQHMKENYHIQPDTCHITCMVDLLGRAGCFNEAKCLLKDHMQPFILPWITLLNACRLYGNAELGQWCFHEIVHLDRFCAAAYVLMSNILATTSFSQDARKVQEHGEVM